MAHGTHRGHKFDVANLEKLRDPERARYLDPEAVWAVIGGGPPRILIEIGAGLGHFALAFARKMPEGLIFACDIQPEILDHLRGVLAKEGVSNVKPLLSEEVRVPLSDQIADVVFMANLHHELDDPDGSLDQCRRLLRPGGIVAVVDWKPEAPQSGRPAGPPVEVRISPDRVRAQLEAAGFQGMRSHDVMPYHYFLTAEKPGGC